MCCFIHFFSEHVICINFLVALFSFENNRCFVFSRSVTFTVYTSICSVHRPISEPFCMRRLPVQYLSIWFEPRYFFCLFCPVPLWIFFRSSIYIGVIKVCLFFKI